MKVHTQTHSGVRIPCDLCSQTFLTKKYLARHKREKHPPDGKFPYPCKNCNKKFTSKYNWLEHTRHVHGDELVHCPGCQLGFKTTIAMFQHRQANEDCLAVEVPEEHKTAIEKIHIENRQHFSLWFNPK